MLSAVRAGHGVTFISRRSVEADLAAGTLVEARVEGLELERDVFVVRASGRADTRAARAFLDDVKLVTDKPIRYVVNTHFHYDHTDGNQVYAGKADIIAHDYVKQAIQTLDVLRREPYQTSQLVNVPRRIADLKRQIAGAKDAASKQMLEQQLKVAQEGFDQLTEIKPTPPNVTYSTQKVLDLGGRDHRLRAVAQAELHQHAADVGLDGLLADEELAGHRFGRRAVAADQLDYLPLAL